MRTADIVAMIDDEQPKAWTTGIEAHVLAFIPRSTYDEPIACGLAVDDARRTLATTALDETGRTLTDDRTESWAWVRQLHDGTSFAPCVSSGTEWTHAMFTSTVALGDFAKLAMSARASWAPVGTPLDSDRWVDLGYTLTDGLMIIDDPQPVRPIRWDTGQRISMTLTWKGGVSRAGWRALVGPKPPFGCGWRRHHLGRRQIMRRMHASYGRRRR